MKTQLFTCALLLATVACSNSHSSPVMATSEASITADSATALHITDLNGHAVAGAQVLIGPKQNSPFAGNLVTADASGTATLPTGWTTAQDVTINADGYVRATYIAQTPGSHTFMIRPTLVQQPRTVAGNTTGFGNLPNDGTLDVALVFKTFDLRNLTNFQITDVVSPRMDSITIVGQTKQIPSNVTIPDQKETYIFPIHFNKPNYSLDFYELGTFSLMAVRAQAPFGQLVKAMLGGKSLMDEINLMKFVSAGEQQVTVTANGGTLDIPVGTYAFNTNFSWSAPSFDDTNNMMLAVAMAADGSTYYPTDIKRFASGQAITMSTVASTPNAVQGAGLVLSVLRAATATPVGAAAEQVSLTFLPMSAVTAPSFLELLPTPQAAAGVITMKVPAAQGLKPLMTTLTGSKIDPTNALLLTPTWDVFASGWVDHVNLPVWPGEDVGVLATSARWSISYGAEDANGPDVPLSPSAMQNATHLTRSAVDL